MEWLARKLVPIALLHPSTVSSTDNVRGIVTVIWPYSPSKRELSLVLADKDFRLRRNGQARIVFYGHSAKAVADAGVLSGDELALSLDGVEWLSQTSQERTPGRGIDWKLQFNQHLLLAVSLVGENGSVAHQIYRYTAKGPKEECHQ
jgi:hypothetical protein